MGQLADVRVRAGAFALSGHAIDDVLLTAVSRSPNVMMALSFLYHWCSGTAVLARSIFGRDKLDSLVSLIGNVSLISTDVFDTLLLRNSRSEPSRMAEGERLFSELLADRGYEISPQLLIDARVQAQRLSFRALSLRGKDGEVRLSDIVSSQLFILGLPQSFVDERIHIEVQVEKGSLSANWRLGRILKAHQRAGARIVAISDTTLSGADVEELIRHFHGPDLIDCVYSSADTNLTKRHGGLFQFVLRAENMSPTRMIHIGDDRHADVKMPNANGIAGHHTPRLSLYRYRRGLDRVLSAAKPLLVKQVAPKSAGVSMPNDAFSFGQQVFGPVVTQFALRIWLYASAANSENKSVMMFCARGGVGIREVFERTLAKLNLPLSVRRENLMISRLIAARAAVLAKGEAAAEELDREFRSSTFADVAVALGGRRYEFPIQWYEAFAGRTFLEMIFGASGAAVRSDIESQNSLFTQHFLQLVGDADRIILCDTGLYGSTQRLLECGFPHLRIETVQFARSNYKKHGEEHFPRVVGLMVEDDYYNPLNVFSCVLRYWHAIESLFEPAIPSARTFWKDERGNVAGNCGDIRFAAIDPAADNPLLAGALAYVDVLPAAGGGATALYQANFAWHRLRDAITHPKGADVRCLSVGARSVDFGRSSVIEAIAPEQKISLVMKIASLKLQLWREGAIVSGFPKLKHILLPAVEGMQSLRGLLSYWR